MLTLSPFKIGIFRQCPRRYKFHYLDGLYETYRKWWPFYTMGAHVHTALARFLSPLNRDRSYPCLERLLRESWVRQRKGFANLDEERDYFERARVMLRWFHAHEDPEARPYMLEAKHKVALSPGLVLQGRVDRVEREADGSLRVIDYKTSKSSLWAGDFQLRVYALLLSRRLRAPVGEVGYLFLNGDGLVSLAPSEAQLAATLEEVLTAQREIEAERDFAPRENQFCPWCDFRELCDPVAAGEPWDGEWEGED